MADDDWIDPDIQAMQLGFGEKAGLQIYRNYTRSFEDHALTLFRQSLDAQSADFSALEKLTELLVEDDLRFLPLLVCAFADEQLERAFRDILPEAIPGGKANMFGNYGPLSDLSKRIKLAFAFDVVSADIMTDLDRLRSARNKISHSWDVSALDGFHAKGRLKDLFPLELEIAERGANDPELRAVLDEASAFRVRLIWLSGRIAYEAIFYGAAKKSRLSPRRALYEGGGTKWLTAVAKICMERTRSVIRTLPQASSESGLPPS